MKETPNYFSILTAEVRYDKNLKDKAKLLYSEITALSDKYGYCYASNKYFAELYNVTPTTISLLIKDLVDNGYIESEIIYKEGTKEILNRYLKIVKGGYLKNLKEGYLRKVKDNNTSNNNTSNNIYNNNIYDFIQENFGRKLSPLEYEEISTWEDNDLTRYTIKEAVLGGKYNIKYISVVLNNYKKNSITTVQQAQEEKERFKNKGKKEKITPSWLNKEITSDEMTPEEEAEFRKRLYEINET